MATWIRHPTVWLPFLLSMVAFAFVVGYAATSGTAVHQGERAPARLFQLLMLAEVVLVAVFAVRWLRRTPKRAGQILAGQIVAALIPVATLIYLESQG